jgi:hypothetical protein
MLFQQRFGGIKNPRSLDHYHVFTTCSLNQESLHEITQEIKQIILDKRELAEIKKMSGSMII